MNRIRPLPLVLPLLLAGTSAAQEPSLVELRRGFDTELSQKVRDDDGWGDPDSELFSKVDYRGPAGRLSAWLSGAPEGADPASKHPVMLWVTGGFPAGGAGSSAWLPSDQDNDQSAKIYRESGMVMMYPSFRGSFGNDGYQEGFLGEVDDLLAAIDYVKTVSYVDPKQVFVGGHSTGGTMALLAAASTNELRGVISLGPVADPFDYGEDTVLHKLGREGERSLRAPIRHLERIQVPTIVIEGENGNAPSLRAMRDATANASIQFIEVPGTDHFELIASVNRVLAKKLTRLGKRDSVRVSADDVTEALLSQRVELRKAELLSEVSRRLRVGLGVDDKIFAEWRFYGQDRAAVDEAVAELTKAGFLARPTEVVEDDDGTWFIVDIRKRVAPSNFKAMFKAAREFTEAQTAHRLVYGGWEFLES
ncbi:MAG: prolyl oligopeptidase family serine peptidase [Planctomycetota bacterium]